MKQRRPLILYLEDDAAIAEMYKVGLEHGGFDVTIAARGPEALELARREPCDLVLLDVMVPGMDGIEVLAAIRSDDLLKDLPVAILSNSELGGPARERARRLGALDWLTKSRNPPDAVVRHLRRWLPRSKAEARTKSRSA
ncbi:MAG: response regulator [Candidatus Dormibacteraeota bacterium]|nr:response regulator [Candidatus Dormibacteraeota bacterium]